jgi:hypothetical protein
MNAQMGKKEFFMNSSLFFQFLNIVVRNNEVSTYEMLETFKLALSAYEMCGAKDSALPAWVEVMKNMDSEVKEDVKDVKEVKEEKEEVKLFKSKTRSHAEKFNAIIKTHLDMRSNVSREKAKVILASLDGTVYDDLEKNITKELKKG